MTNESEILFPKKEIKIGRETIVVREMLWHDTLDFLEKLSGYLSSFFKVGANGELAVDISPNVLVQLVTNTDELSSELVMKTSGKDGEWIKTLSTGQMLDLLDVALELNLSEDLFERGKRIAGRFQKFTVAAPRIALPASGKPTISSSLKDTAAPSSTAAPSVS